MNASPVILTALQRDTLSFVWTYWQENRVGPRLRDISDQFGVSKVAVHDRLLLLAKKGCVTREKFAARALRVTKRGRSALGLKDGQTPLHALRAAWVLANAADRKTFLKEARRK